MSKVAVKSYSRRKIRPAPTNAKKTVSVKSYSRKKAKKAKKRRSRQQTMF